MCRVFTIMKDFDLRQWTDYVRGITPEAERQRLEEHLAAGCQECRRTVELLGRVAANYRREVEYEPPERLVERAKAIFAQAAWAHPPALPRLAARLLYDSFRDPQPVGVRSSRHASRQALYEAGDYCLDLRLEDEPRQHQLTLVGQIANRQVPDQPMSGLPVFLLSGEEVLTLAHSNQYGEFHLQAGWRRNLRLCVPVSAAGRRIEIPLSRLLGSYSLSPRKREEA